MKKRVTVTLPGLWILEHKEDEVRPILFLKSTLENKYSEKIAIQGITHKTISFDLTEGDFTAADVIKFICDTFKEKYTLEDASKVVSTAVEDLEEEEDDDDDGIEDLFAKFFGDDDDEDEEADEDNPPADVKGETVKEPVVDTKESKVDAVMKKINGLIGGDEFKALAKEIRLVAPQLIKSGSAEVFAHQAYLISINSGSGLSTYLSVFAELLQELGIMKVSPKNISEDKLKAPDDKKSAPSIYVRRGGITCVDISEWMNDLNTPGFKEALLDVQKEMDSSLVVFRIPFVEKEVLAKVQTSLNDLLFVRTISIPPFTADELQEYACTELAKYGLKATKTAWPAFHARIREEKSDGRFYGLNTVKKVIRELIYKKQLSNAKREKPDNLIGKRDMAKVCTSIIYEELSGMEMLDNLVAADSIKNRINEILAQIEFARSSGDVEMPCIHMRFVGNPGTGKTTVARILGKILKDRGVLRVGAFHEHRGRDFCGRYIGETAPKTAAICRDAYGSVLFIDEAYSLYKGAEDKKDYGREALDTLITEMENHRSDIVIIMAGYTDEMEHLMEGNTGLASRMPYLVEFPNFTREDLYKIFVSMLGKKFAYDEEVLPLAKDYFLGIPDSVINTKTFSNARFVRNLFERTWSKAALRCQLEKVSNVRITKADFESATSDKEFTYTMQDKPANRKIGFSV